MMPKNTLLLLARIAYYYLLGIILGLSHFLPSVRVAVPFIKIAIFFAKPQKFGNNSGIDHANEIDSLTRVAKLDVG